MDGGTATVLASAIGGVALLASGVIAWLTGRSSRQAEKQRDTLAERDRLIDQLQEDRDALGRRIEALERRIEALEEQRAEDRVLLDSARAHIAHLESLVPPPPPARPAGL